MSALPLPEAAASRNPWSARVGAWLLVVFAALAYWLFFQPEGGREWHLWSVFGNVRPGSIYWGGNPLAVLRLPLAMLGLTLIIGLPVMRCFAARLPALHLAEWLAGSLLLGMGTIGIVGELLGLAGNLQMAPVAVSLLLVYYVALKLGNALWGAPIAWREWMHRVSGPVTLAQDIEWMRRHVLELWPADPAPRWLRVVALPMLGLTMLILALTFWHALFYPVTYWDAMILYVGYARMIHDAGYIPEYVCGQVGIGLGANYTHLFSFYHIAANKMFTPEFSPLFAQAISPLCGVAVVTFLFALVRRMGGGFWAASATALVSVSFHYILAYYQYASNYPMAMAFTVLFLWASWLHLRHQGSRGALALAIATAAVAVHINYLMWLLWIAGLVLTCLVPWRRALFVGRDYWLMVALGLALASPWYIRNVVVTGNPVYAFYANIFPSKHVNAEVMESAGREWLQNGDGIGRHARDLFGEGYGLREKLRASGVFFVTGSQAYKLGPVFLGWMVPGLLAALLAVAGGAAYRLAEARGKTGESPGQCDVADGAYCFDPTLRFAVLAAVLMFLFLFYHYAVADFYLYQILPFLVPGALFAGWALRLVERERAAAAVATVLLLATGLVPGLAFGLMGLKQFQGAHQLQALHLPLMDAKDFYRLRYGGDVDMWHSINLRFSGGRLLTHENRHLVFPGIELVHLDDWELQQAYDLATPEAKLRRVIAQNLHFYLRVPNEARHPVNARLGLEAFVGTPVLREVARTVGSDGANILYEIDGEELARLFPHPASKR